MNTHIDFDAFLRSTRRVTGAGLVHWGHVYNGTEAWCRSTYVDVRTASPDHPITCLWCLCQQRYW